MRTALVFLAIFVAVRTHAQPADICSFVPAGGEATNIPVEDYERNAGIYGKCVSLYTDRGQASVFLFKSPEIAKTQVEGHKTFSERDHMGSPDDPNPTAQPYSIGDAGYEVTKEQVPPGEEDSPVRYNIAFSRGCYQVYVNAGGALGMSFIRAGGEGEWNASKEWVRTTAATINDNLANAPCPDTGGTPPPPPPGMLGVTVACQTNFDQADLVVCTAQAQNQKTDAALSYQWAFDGAAQSARGSELTLTGIKPGAHTVTVLTSDSVNQLVSPPATASFTKQEPGSSGGRSSVPPIVPIVIITTVVLGGIGTGIAIARRKRPPPPALTPGGITPLGDAPREQPPAQARPPFPPERLAPRRPPAPPDQLAPTKPPLPPERLAKPPRPGDASQTTDNRQPKTPQTQDEHRDGDVWLEAGKTEITLRADGRQEIIVTVRALQQTGGVVSDAAADVFPTKDATLPKKIHLTPQPGYCAFGVRGTHAGSTPVVGKITVTGTSSTGRRVRPAEITVHLEPVSIDVKIKVWKKGFRFQDAVATLPGMCREVRGKVEGGESSEVVGRGAAFVNALQGGTSRVVAKAHCTASLRVGDGGWSSPVEVHTSDAGTFFFGLPSRTIQVYGDDLGSYDLPTTFQLGIDDEVQSALKGYRTALADFQRDLAYNPAGSDYAAPIGQCTNYPDEFLDQLRRNEEEQYLKEMSAIHRLRCGILFALKYRRDLNSQRRILDYASSEALGSIVDVITDFLPVAMGIFQWLGGKGVQKVVGGVTYVLPGFPQFMLDLAKGVKRIPGMWYVAKGLVLFVRFLKAPVVALEKAVGWLLESALDLAQAAGLKTQYLKDLARLGQTPNEIPIGELFDDASNPIAEMAKIFSDSSYILVRSALRAVVGLMHAFVIVIASTLKAIAFFIKNMNWGAEGSWAATVCEVIEDLLGKLAGAVYDNFGSILDQLLEGSSLGEKKEPSALSRKNAADVVMDALVSMKDLDGHCAPALQHAYERSLDLNVEEDWEGAVRKVSKQELVVMARFEKASEAVSVLDRGAPFVKLAVKIVQMITFAWGTVGQASIKLVGKAAEKLGPSIPYLRDFQAFLQGTSGKDALDFAGTFEKWIDVAELVMVRAPILLKEIVTLKCIYAMAPTRIKALYE